MYIFFFHFFIFFNIEVSGLAENIYYKKIDMDDIFFLLSASIINLILPKER